MGAYAKQLIAAIIVFIIAYLYAMCLATTLFKYEIHYTCMVPSPIAIHSRGANYYIAGNKGPQPYCLMTFWNFTHVMLYTVLGILCPDITLELFAAGVAFELYEAKKYDCHDLLDIAYNGLGLLLGHIIRRTTF